MRLYVAVGLVVLSVALTEAAENADPPMSAAPATAASAAPMAEDISDTVVSRLVALGVSKKKDRFGALDLFGLDERQGGSTRLFMTSARNGIARKSLEAARSNGTYTPLAADRRDTVDIHCGDAELSSRFDCSKLSVQANGQDVRPLVYSDGPSEHHNAMGAKWSTLGVSASYDARALKGGFVVDYAAPDGMSWKYTVTPRMAAKGLLLAIDDEPESGKKK